MCFFGRGSYTANAYQVKTVYEMTINELSESSLKANQGLSLQLEQERAKWQAHATREGQVVQAQVHNFLDW